MQVIEVYIDIYIYIYIYTSILVCINPGYHTEKAVVMVDASTVHQGRLAVEKETMLH
jgi:hypothetical protein